MKTNSPALTYCVSPIDMVLSADNWISHFQPWWKNQSRIAYKNVIRSIYHQCLCSAELCCQCWCELRFPREWLIPKTPACFCTQCSFSLNLLQFSVLIKRKSIAPEINIDLSRSKTATELCQQWPHNWCKMVIQSACKCRVYCEQLNWFCFISP